MHASVCGVVVRNTTLIVLGGHLTSDHDLVQGQCLVGSSNWGGLSSQM